MTGFLGIDAALFTIFNGLAGRSWAFDSLVALIDDNNLIKGAVLGACFMAAWYKQEHEHTAVRIRSILLASLVASVLALSVTKTISHLLFFPRPYMFSQKLYHLDDGRLREFETIDFNLPLDDSSRELYSDFLNGDFTLNHLGTFPSDNASFCIAIALGIFFAYRSIGLIALVWALAVLLPVKIIMGKHFPIDIVAGALVAVVSCVFIKFLAGGPLERSFARAAEWTLRHNTLSSALIFVVVYEIVSTLDHLYPFIAFIGALGRHALGL